MAEVNFTDIPIVDERTKLQQKGTIPTQSTPKLTGAERAAATIQARKDRFAAELEAREASKPTTDPGPGNVWSYNVSEGKWKRVNVAGGFGGTGITGGNTGGSGFTGEDTFTASDGSRFTNYAQYIAYENSLRNKSLTANATAAAETAERKSAYDLLYQQFAKYGLQGLVTPLEGLFKEGVPASEFAIRLRETDALRC
jgi:hypothetical protein